VVIFVTKGVPDMKTKDLIRELQANDPEGEAEVCIGNVPIHFVERLPAFYDGPLQVLIRDESRNYYNVIGAKYVRTGLKVEIHTHSISDAIIENPDLPVDYSALSDPNKVRTHHEKLRRYCRDSEDKLDRNYFCEWAKTEALKITEDIEDFTEDAGYFYDEHLSREDPLPEGGVPLGTNYVETRRKQWSEKFFVTNVDGFLEIKRKISSTLELTPKELGKAPEIVIEHVTLRPFADGSLDEVLLYDKDGKLLLHLEKMDDRLFWGRTNNDIVLWFDGRKSRIKLTYEVDRPEIDASNSL
jgi:hypothetical protein